MFIGKWNKSVILSYLGVCFACFGIYLAIAGFANYACICLVLAGVCDMFDGAVARMLSRSEEDKKFGIELDSLADMVDFIALPIVIILSQNKGSIAVLASFALAICGIARLAHFNIAAMRRKEKLKYYQGLPVTFSALIFPVAFLMAKCFFPEQENHVLPITALITAALNILNIKIPKPYGLAYGIFSGIAIALTILLIIL